MARISFTVLNKPAGKRGVLKADGQGYYEQVIGGLNIDNSANMRYTAEKSVVELFNNSSTLRRKMDRGVLRGEIGHPKLVPGMSKADYINRLFQIYEENTCVQFKEIWLDDTVSKNPDGSPVWTIMAKFTPSGAKGEFLDRQLKNGDENVCFSIRSFTDDYKVSGKWHRDIVEIVTFDYVNEPGIHTAEKYKSPALEGIANGTEVLVTQQDFDRAFNEAVKMGIATESSVVSSRDKMFKQFGWTSALKKPGYLSL